VLTEYDIIDKLQMRAIARRDNAIAALERYRNGMGNRVKGMIDEMMAASAAGELTTEKFLDINSPAQEWAEWLAEHEAREAKYFDKKPEPPSEVPATRDAQLVAAQPQRLAAVTDPPLVRPGGIDKELAPVDASAAADAQKLQPAEPESEPQQARQAPSATDTQQAAAHPENLAAVTDAPHTQPGGIDKEPAPVDASAAADAQKLEPAEPESGSLPAREASTATDLQQAAADPQNLPAVPQAPDPQAGGVDQEPAPVEVSAADDAPKLQPAMPENVPQQAREAPSATKEHPQ
jgi:hypothetical protein